MEFTVASAAGRPLIGLHEADRYDVVLDIERCLLQSEPMNALLNEMRAQVHARGLTVYDQDAGQGLLRFVAIREGRRTGDTMVNVVAAAPDVEGLTPLAEQLRVRVPSTASVVLNVNAKKAAVAVGTEEHVLIGREHITERLGDLVFQVSANSFFQTNTLQAERLFAVVEAACALTGNESVVDLYSGTGAISLLLARRCRHGGGGRSAAGRLPSQGPQRPGGPEPGPPGLRLLQPVHPGSRRRRPAAPGLPVGVGAAGGHVSADAPHRGRRPSQPGERDGT
jgi:23S rRNA (uracil1939-C5)-methyltransferase